MLKLRDSNNKRLEELARSHDLSKKEMLTLLLDIYDMNRVDALVTRISAIKNRGMDAKQLNQLSLLFSYLASIFRNFAR